jgi:hypothetical protein
MGYKIMKNKIIGWIAAIWGGLILLSGLIKLFSGQIPAGAYGMGQLAGYLFGCLLLFFGIKQIRKEMK